jgi:hypothetical protein
MFLTPLNHRLLSLIEGERVVVIKKPMYPPGAYRAPSGGVSPGE